MRVTDRVEERPAASSSRPRGSFADSLRAREAAAGAAKGARDRRAGSGSKAGMAKDAELRDRREVSSGAERGASDAAPALPGPDVRREHDAASVPELRAAVGALPVAVQAAHLRDGGPLALSLGRSLDVEIRAGAAGLEVSLRPEPRLARAAAAELPALAAALRARGIAVARVEVCARGPRGRERPR